jgi:hypothetical protein
MLWRGGSFFRSPPEEVLFSIALVSENHESGLGVKGGLAAEGIP